MCYLYNLGMKTKGEPPCVKDFSRINSLPPEIERNSSPKGGETNMETLSDAWLDLTIENPVGITVRYVSSHLSQEQICLRSVVFIICDRQLECYLVSQNRELLRRMRDSHVNLLQKNKKCVKWKKNQ